MVTDFSIPSGKCHLGLGRELICEMVPCLLLSTVVVEAFAPFMPPGALHLPSPQSPETQSSRQLSWEVPWGECISLTEDVDFLLGFSLCDYYFCLKSLKHLSLPHKPKENKP